MAARIFARDGAGNSRGAQQWPETRLRADTLSAKGHDDSSLVKDFNSNAGVSL